MERDSGVKSTPRGGPPPHFPSRDLVGGKVGETVHSPPRENFATYMIID